MESAGRPILDRHDSAGAATVENTGNPGSVYLYSLDVTQGFDLAQREKA